MFVIVCLFGLGSSACLEIYVSVFWFPLHFIWSLPCGFTGPVCDFAVSISDGGVLNSYLWLSWVVTIYSINLYCLVAAYILCCLLSSYYRVLRALEFIFIQPYYDGIPSKVFLALCPILSEIGSPPSQDKWISGWKQHGWIFPITLANFALCILGVEEVQQKPFFQPIADVRSTFLKGSDGFLSSEQPLSWRFGLKATLPEQDPLCWRFFGCGLLWFHVSLERCWGIPLSQVSFTHHLFSFTLLPPPHPSHFQYFALHCYGSVFWTIPSSCCSLCSSSFFNLFIPVSAITGWCLYLTSTSRDVLLH